MIHVLYNARKALFSSQGGLSRTSASSAPCSWGTSQVVRVVSTWSASSACTELGASGLHAKTCSQRVQPAGTSRSTAPRARLPCRRASRRGHAPGSDPERERSWCRPRRVDPSTLCRFGLRARSPLQSKRLPLLRPASTPGWCSCGSWLARQAAAVPWGARRRCNAPQQGGGL